MEEVPGLGWSRGEAAGHPHPLPPCRWQSGQGQADNTVLQAWLMDKILAKTQTAGKHEKPLPDAGVQCRPALVISQYAEMCLFIV